MNHPMKCVLFACVSFCAACSAMANEAAEPSAEGPGVVDLLASGTLDAWQTPPAHWRLEEGSIVGDTGPEKITIPEWIYSKQRFGDFVFSCEMKLSGDKGRNTGIYYRVNTFTFKGVFPQVRDLVRCK